MRRLLHAWSENYYPLNCEYTEIMLMKRQTGLKGFAADEIRILTFKIMGIEFGMDMDRISEMCDPDQAKRRKIKLFQFHEKLHFRMAEIEYKSPKVLLIRDEESALGVVIDQPEEIDAPVRTDSILPMPPLIETSKSSAPIWAATLRNEKIVLLVDPHKLLANVTIMPRDALW